MNTKKQSLFIACDHGALDLKNTLVSWLRENDAFKHFNIFDEGVHTTDSVDYPDVAYKLVCEMRKNGDDSFGILLCGSGIGVSIAANRHVDMRAALVNEPVSAALARAHNNANIMCMGARVIGVDMAKACVCAFFKTSFDGGRHDGRVKKLSHISQPPLNPAP